MKRLLIDIETAPHKAYVWGPKNAYINPNHIAEDGYTLCFAAKWYGKRGLVFKSVHDEDMIETAFDMLSEADAVIHYNGTKFDIPTLNADFAERRMGVPRPFHEIDLLKVCRSRFRRYSLKLDEVARWLGMKGKVKHMGMDMWKLCMSGDRKAWVLMERYNKQDVNLLEDVYNELLPWIKTHPNHALYADDNRPVCTNCGSQQMTRQGFAHTKTQSYQQYRCKSCGTWMRERLTALPASKRANVLVQA